MGELNKEIFVCLDCETTGLDVKKDCIIEVAAVRFTSNKTLASFESLVNPGCEIPLESYAIHGIAQKDLEGKPKIDTILPELLEVLGQYPIVGHGVAFDIEMVARAATQAGISHNLMNHPYIDTLRLARHYGQSPVNSLEGLATHFNVNFDQSHRAMADVQSNIEVFKHLTKRFHKTEEIFQVLSHAIQMKTMPLGKHKGRPFSEIPLDYLQWAVRLDFDEDLIFSIRQELKRRSRGSSFLQKSNPFADLDWQ